MPDKWETMMCLREETTLAEAVHRQDLAFPDIGGRQIMSALLREIGVRKGLPNDSLLWKCLQRVANEARKRGLLINPNPWSRETYSSAVGNTSRMLPSSQGWEQTKGILSRELVDLREKLARATLKAGWNNSSSNTASHSCTGSRSNCYSQSESVKT